MRLQTMWIGGLCAGAVMMGTVQSSRAAIFDGVRFNGQLIQVDTTAHTVTPLGTITAGPNHPDQFVDLDFDGGGTLYAVRGYYDGNFPPTNFNEIYRVNNPATGASVLSASLDNSTAQRHANFAFRPSTGLFYSNRNSDGHMGTLNVTTGAFGDTGVANGYRTVVEALAVDPISGQGYGILDMGLSFIGTIDYSLYRVNLDTGAATLVGSLGQGSEQFKALRFDSAGTAYTVDYATGDFYTVNTATGAATFSFAGGPGAINTTGLALLVPGPASAGLFAIGATALLRRRRRAVC